LSKKSPLFILGAPRSFTTETAALLGRHPCGYSAPELNLLTKRSLREFINENKDIYYNQNHGILRTVAELYAGEQTMETISMAHRWMIKRIDWKTSEIYNRICEKIYPLTLVDKSPAYAFNPQTLHRINEHFPSANYIHLTRHPVDMNYSMHQLEQNKIIAVLTNSLDKSKGKEVVDPQLMWFACNAITEEFLKKIDNRRKIRIKGEDIMNERTETLEKICDWLNWEWTNEANELMKHPEDSVYARFGPIGAELGSDPKFLRSPQIKENYKPNPYKSIGVIS
jgi:hypothetical protein